MGDVVEGSTTAPPAAAPHDPKSNGEPLELSKTLVGGLTTVLAALTGIATANTEIVRMFRNNPILSVVGVVLVLVAMTCGLLSLVNLPSLRKPWVSVAGVIALVLAILVLVWAQVDALALSDRPKIDIKYSHDGSTVLIAGTVESNKAKAHDQVAVMAWAILPDGARAGPLHYAKTGPSTDGSVNHSFEMLIDSALYAGVNVSAVVIPEEVLPVNVDCDGAIVGEDGKLTGQSFRPGDDDPLVACYSATFPTSWRTTLATAPDSSIVATSPTSPD